MHPPNNSAASPPIFSCPTSASQDNLFFLSSLHFGQEIGHLASDDLFFFGLHFIALHCGGKNLGNCAGVSNLLNHPPNLEKWQKMVNFAESSFPMLYMNLHPWL